MAVALLEKETRGEFDAKADAEGRSDCEEVTLCECTPDADPLIDPAAEVAAGVPVPAWGEVVQVW